MRCEVPQSGSGQWLQVAGQIVRRPMSHALEFIGWLRAAVEPPRQITGEELVVQWRSSSGALTLPEALRLAQAMDATGFSFEPDPRFSGHIVRPNDRVILFQAVSSDGPSPAYLAAATIARLGVIVASADGAVVPEEQAVMREHTASAIDLSDRERRRLAAYVEWLLDTPIALDAIEREGAGLSEDARLRIGNFLVAVAGADHHIAPPERWILSGAFALFGLTKRHLEDAIASVSSPDPPAVGEGDPQSEVVGISRTSVEVLLSGGEAIEDLAGLFSVVPVERPSPMINVVAKSDGTERGAAERFAGARLTNEERTAAAVEQMFAEFGPPTSEEPPSPSGSGMRSQMTKWETDLAHKWSPLHGSERRRAGSLLTLIPGRPEWQEFIAAWKAHSLGYWLLYTPEYPHAIAVLFGGFAFFEYEETSFWPQFKRDLWPISEAQTAALRTAHERAIDRLGLELVRNQSSDRMTVGSAVHHIGVPLSLWADFLVIADHVLRQDDWKSWTSEVWQEDVAARCGPRVRLRNFLVANEAAARETIDELRQIRDFATDDPTTTIEDLADIANVPFLRDEYFDEVPETAEFFRPDNLLSLFAGRYFLRFDEENSRLQVHLPRVDEPGGSVWKVGDHEQPARREPAWMTIDSAGFARWVDIHLVSTSGRRTKRIAGVGDWGLYDQRREAFLDLDLWRATELRMGDYVLVSERPLTHMIRRGFLGDFPENQAANLEDGTRCFVTRLSPAGLEGSLDVRWATVEGDLRDCTITFRTRLTTRAKTIMVNGVERPIVFPSLPWYFLRPGPYPPVSYASLTTMELTKMDNQGSASAYARLKRYTEEGVIIARADGAWRLDHERARVRRLRDTINGDVIEVRLLGLPTHMWGLGRDREPLSVEIVGEEGLTYLRATWPAAYESAILERLRRYEIDVVRP